MDKVSTLEFTWERWGGRYFGLDEIISPFDAKKERFYLLKNIVPIGYQESSKIPIRPRERGIVLLFKFDGEDEIYWIHLPSFGAEDIIHLKGKED